MTQGQKVCGEQWEEVQYGCSMWYMKHGVESDTETPCSLNYHLRFYCQMETYWRKISTIMKGLEIVHKSEYKAPWIFNLENKTFIYLLICHYIYFQILGMFLGR